VVVIALLIAGDQVPVIPFMDVVGSADNEAPEQIGETWLNNGLTIGVTVTVIVAVVAHWPSEGVNK
jgi:hypothetical protein